MFRRIRNRKTLLLSLLATFLCLILSVFTFGTIYAAKTGNTASSGQSTNYLHQQSLIAARKRKTPTPTPVKGKTPTPTPTTTIPIATATTGVTATVTPPPVGSSGIKIFVEPNAGEQVILNGINNAQKSVWLEMYLLTDTNVIQALEADAKNGLDVRVMLEPHPYGGGSPASTEAALKAAGVQVADTNPAFALTHEKGMIIDGSIAYIMTTNLTYSALNGKNREYGIIDSNSQDVQGVVAIFNADWNRTTPQLSDKSLVVSPVNARTDFVTLINSAQSSLIIEAEEMQDSNIEQAIASAAQRGVNVQVILPNPSSSPDPNATGIATIKAGGAQVRIDAQLYMHAKIIVVDGKQAFVGSENISTYSLDKNRELGILLTDSSVLATLQQTFQQDWGVSQPAFFWGY